MESAANIGELTADEAAQRIGELANIISDAVKHGASVNFLAGVSDEECRGFWQASIRDQHEGGRRLFVAEFDGLVVGTALLILAPQQNQPHRADVGKMLVHSGYRRRGLARLLLAAIEQAAMETGRTLLMLDTSKDSTGERLYQSTGWVRYGEVPGHAMDPDGTLWPTSFFYKEL